MPRTIAEIPLYSVFAMEPNDYYVVYNNPTDHLPIKPLADRQRDDRLILSSGYVLIRPPDPTLPPRPDPNILDAHNVVIKREARVRVDGMLDFRSIYVDRQLIYRNWVRCHPIDPCNPDDPNRGPRYYERAFDIEKANWWHVVYPTMEKDVNDPETNMMGMVDQDHINEEAYKPRGLDISVPLSSDADESFPLDNEMRLATVGDISRIWTVGPRDFLYDPEDIDEPDAPGGIYDPCSLVPAGPNDVNGIYVGYNLNSRTAAEKLRLASTREEYEELVRIDLGDPHYRNLFQYITVFDPSLDGIDNDGDGLIDSDDNSGPEFKVPGRININTAPWYVIAQLPWMTGTTAQAIAAYRDKLDITNVDYSGDEDIGRYSEIRNEIASRFNQDDIREEYGFASIGELNFVIGASDDDYSMRRYGLDSTDIDGFPDLTTYEPDDDDDAVDDFEERDMIFCRISNLVTVRSDVFTAYILVRIGADGPQKRVIAILDRSDVYSGNGKVKVVALQPVPDPR